MARSITQPLYHALNISGWMTATELKWLRAIALSMPPGARFFELGVWRGRTTVALAVSRLNLTCVDTWRGEPGDLTWAILATNEDIYAAFISNMRRLNLHPKILKMDTLQAAERVPDNSLHGVFNDAAHGPSFELNFWAWLRKIKRGGLYCGHDYSEGFPEIPRVLKGSGLEFGVVSGTSIWCLIKP